MNPVAGKRETDVTVRDVPGDESIGWPGLWVIRDNGVCQNSLYLQYS
jgi:hypothetical protein